MIEINIPNVGQIIGCWFPYDETPSPGKDFRPCLVLQVIKSIDNMVYLNMCYGTGQTSDSNKGVPAPWAFEVERGNKNNLPETTKFNLKKVAILPFADRFFKHPSNFKVSFSKFGSLTEDQTLIANKKIENYGGLASHLHSQRTLVIKK